MPGYGLVLCDSFRPMLTYSFKFRPKACRDGYLNDQIDRHNMLWNKMVWIEDISQKRRKGQKNRHINGSIMNRYVNLHKKGHGWDYMIEGLDTQSIQADIQRREVAFDRFFKWAEDKKNGKNPKRKESPPTYKRVHGEGSFTLKQTGYKVTETAVEVGNFSRKDTHTYRTFVSRPIEGKIKTCTIRRDKEGFMWAHIVTDHTPQENLPKTGKKMGFDFDAEHYFVDADGRYWDAPRVLNKHFAELRKLDKRIGRCKEGSKNKERLYEQKRIIERHISEARDDWQWKMARDMCRRFDVLCFEGLDLADMGCKNKVAEKDMTPAEKGRMRKWRRKLRDYAPGAFIEKVKWIAKKTGKTVWIDDQWDATTQKCHSCGHKNPRLKDVNIKKWVCPECGMKHDRDINAAKNVLAAYLRWEEEQSKQKAKKDLKGSEKGAGGASSVDVGQSDEPERASRWARIRKTKKPLGVFAGLAVENHHGTQTHGDGYVGGIPQASAVGGCQGSSCTNGTGCGILGIPSARGPRTRPGRI